MADVKTLAESQDKKDAPPPKTAKGKPDPNKQHFKYLLQSCDTMNQQFLNSLEGGTCVIQGQRREIQLRCKLRKKDDDINLPANEKRFESTGGDI